MAFWTYMLRCADGRYYVGHTDALESRIAQHQAGKASDFTARRQPVVMVWCQDFASRAEALAAERQIKGWSRAKKEALIAGDWERVLALAVSRAARPSTGSGRTEEGITEGTKTAPLSTTLRTNVGLTADLINPVRPEPVEGRAPSQAPAP